MFDKKQSQFTFLEETPDGERDQGEIFRSETPPVDHCCCCRTCTSARHLQRVIK